ncbi:SDR family NAD(P)-dependent oxidoreductase [Nodosilinea sp. LEGE 07088]|uniref:SDR family NAD(P)-dependent oxidoreductase n=1 Tax=Nodosilinea sp. LEGE 07088 TaxID=2777968 RepID=UPI00187DEB15|nr:SDR family NAD(P)-dependent oxidoreductase [Nodosilinea sp. LEGE 07088]MBE9136204.1 SDR family NAD(P)-dependent oxidoreductase [Nodosilinea sp. LEGE 07088]
MQNKRIALITGANKGIGLQIAKDLAAQGLTVLVGSRNLEHGTTVAKSIGANAHALQLDVTDQSSIAAAAERIRSEFGHLDVLVNNAGISHAGKPGSTFADNIKTDSLISAPLENVQAVWATNVFGVIAVTQAMLPLLREAPAARIVNMGSQGGSLTWNSEPENPHRKMFGTYSTSKAAAHAVTLAFAFALEETNIKVNIADPGHTATALNNFSGARTVEQGARRAVQLALLNENGSTGTFSGEDGPVAW